MSVDLSDLNGLRVPANYEISVRLQEHLVVIQAIRWKGVEIVNRLTRGYARSMIDRTAVRITLQSEIDRLVKEIEAQEEPTLGESSLYQNPGGPEDSNNSQEDV